MQLFKKLKDQNSPEKKKNMPNINELQISIKIKVNIQNHTLTMRKFTLKTASVIHSNKTCNCQKASIF